MSDAIIVLPFDEIMIGVMQGGMRLASHITKGRNPLHGQKEGYWQAHIEGVLSEMAFHKYTNMYFSPRLNKLGNVPDAGVMDDIRATRYENGKLIIHPADPDDRRFWLLTGEYGRYTIRGWMMGSDAKQEKYWSELQPGRPAYCVPQADLELP